MNSVISYIEKGWRKRAGEKRIHSEHKVWFSSERVSTLSLRSRLIRLSDFFEARRKVALRSKAYAWPSVLGSFDKFREIGFYPTCFTLDLSDLLMIRLV